MSYTIEHGVWKKLIEEGPPGKNLYWDSQCWDIWDGSSTYLETCNLHFLDLSQKYCAILSSSFSVDEVNELFIKTEAVTRACSTVSKDIQCTGKLILSLYYEMRGKDLEIFALSDKIPPKLLKPNTGFIRSIDNISFSIKQNYNLLKLGFQSHFYCGNIRSISVYSYFCPAKTNVLVGFVEVLAPIRTSSPSISVGTCTENAVKKSSSHRLSMKCYYNGTVVVFGGCECEAGYTNFYEKKRC